MSSDSPEGKRIGAKMSLAAKNEESVLVVSDTHNVTILPLAKLTTSEVLDDFNVAGEYSLASREKVTFECRYVEDTMELGDEVTLGKYHARLAEAGGSRLNEVVVAKVDTNWVNLPEVPNPILAARQMACST